MIQKYDIEIIGYGRLDTYDDIDVSFTYNFEELDDLSARTSKFSKTILLPGTPNNNKFFEYLGDIKVVDGFNANKKIRCNVRIGDNNIFKGFLKLESVVKSLGSDDYEVTIISIDKNLFEEIGDDNLTNLDLSQFNHSRNKQNIQDSWDTSVFINDATSPFALGKGYVYPRIFYGNNTSTSKWYTYDAVPAIYVKTYIDAIFEKYNYTYKSDFFETEYFKRLILPYNKSNISLNEDQLAERQVRVGVSGSSTPLDILDNEPLNDSTYYTKYPMAGLDDESSEQGTSEIFFSDAGGQWDGSRFTCAKQGMYDVEFNGQMVFRYTNSGGGGFAWSGGGGTRHLYRMFLYKASGGGKQMIADSGVNADNPYGEISAEPSDQLPHATPWYDETAASQIRLAKSNLYLEVGDVIDIEFAAKLEQDTTWTVGTNNISMMPTLYRDINSTFTAFTVQVSNPLAFGGLPIEMNQVIPNMKINSFFKGIVNMFNLAIIPDEDDENGLIIEPIDTYLKSKDKIDDWTGLLDRDDEIEITPTSNITSQKYKYTYDDDTDYFNEKYKDEFNETYGYEELVTENEFNIKAQETKLPFASTPDATYLELNKTVMPWFVNIDDRNEITPKGVKPRILFYGGLLDGNDIELVESVIDSAPVTLTQYPYCGHWDHPTDPTYDLNFGPTERIYWNTSLRPVNNLITQFHRRYLESIVSPDGRIFKGNFNLTPTKIAEFDLRDTVQIDGVNWRVLSINDYNPVAYDRTTEVELLKLIDFDPSYEQQASLPSSYPSCPVDIKVNSDNIIWSPSGQEITDDCCKSVGGVLENGTCRIITSNFPGGGGITQSELGPIGIGVSEAPIANGNTITSNTKILGERNTTNLRAEDIIISGDNNNVNNYTPTTIVGDNNTVEGNNSSVFGDGNTVITNVTGSFVVGSNNTFGTSSLSSSITSSLTNIVILGVDNVVATSSYHAYLPENLILSGSDPTINGIPLSTITGSTPTTYNELTASIAAGELLTSQWYDITDFQTIYDQPDYDSAGVVKGTVITKTAASSSILVMATSNNTLAIEAYQPEHPLDKIEYDINFTVTEYEGTAAKGRITKRIDSGSNSTGYDHKEVLFLRYETINASGVYDNFRDTGFGSTEVLTFGAGAYENHIKATGDYSTFVTNNNVFGTGAYWNIFGSVCESNTFGDNNYANEFGDECSANLFGDNVSQNTFGSYSVLNIFGDDCIENTFGESFGGITFGGNTLGDFCKNNSFVNLCFNNTINTTVSGINILTSVDSKTFTLMYDRITYQEDSYRSADDHNITTTNATVTDLYTFTPTDGVHIIEWNVTGFETATGDAIGIKAYATFKVISGVVTQVSTTSLDRKSDFPALVTVIVDTDATDIRCRVRGQGGKIIIWRGSLTITK